MADDRSVATTRGATPSQHDRVALDRRESKALAGRDVIPDPAGVRASRTTPECEAGEGESVRRAKATGDVGDQETMASGARIGNTGDAKRLPA